MPTVLLTGANRGIGLEFARQYGSEGWTVIATCRDPFLPGELATIKGDIRVHGLDVTLHEQIEHLAKDLCDIPIDILINNAGIFGPRQMSATDMDYQKWEQVLRTNTFAPLKMAATFANNIVASNQRKLITISSMMGSLSQNNGGGDYIYRSSKAAVNQVMRSFSDSPEGRNIIVANYHPGWVQTDMGGDSAPISPAKSVECLRRSIANLRTKDTGQFFNYDGKPYSW